MVKDEDETDVDCGGTLCLSIGLACALTKNCNVSVDCESGICHNGVCVSCSDSSKNGDETGTDCGGLVCDACGDGGTCSIGSDCSSGTCDLGSCVS